VIGAGSRRDADAAGGRQTPEPASRRPLVAEGSTNPEVGARPFISRRTVETHLSNVYRKLDIVNRTMPVGALAAHDGRTT
jgi:hypothetical protein